MAETLQKHHIPWEHCIGVSTDNTSVNLGIRNSIMTRVKEKNPAVYFMGCPCHIVHNCALKASEKFAQVSFYFLLTTNLHTCTCHLGDKI